MFWWGIVIMIVGFAALLLPLVGVPVHFLSSLGANREMACIGIAVVGGVLAFIGKRSND
jgi:nitrate reductase gamma subunit